MGHEDMVTCHLSLVTPTHHVHHLPVSVRGPQVQGGVVPHVGCVHARPPPYQHLQDLQVTSLGRPVQRRELVVIPGKEMIKYAYNTRIIIQFRIVVAV